MTGAQLQGIKTRHDSGACYHCSYASLSLPAESQLRLEMDKMNIGILAFWLTGPAHGTSDTGGNKQVPKISWATLRQKCGQSSSGTTISIGVPPCLVAVTRTAATMHRSPSVDGNLFQAHRQLPLQKAAFAVAGLLLQWLLTLRQLTLVCGSVAAWYFYNKEHGAKAGKRLRHVARALPRQPALLPPKVLQSHEQLTVSTCVSCRRQCECAAALPYPCFPQVHIALLCPSASAALHLLLCICLYLCRCCIVRPQVLSTSVSRCRLCWTLMKPSSCLIAPPWALITCAPTRTAVHCTFTAAWATPAPPVLSPSYALGCTSFSSRPANLLSSSSSQLPSLVSASCSTHAHRKVS